MKARFFESGAKVLRTLEEIQANEDTRRCECESLHRAIETLTQECNEAWAIAARTRQEFDAFILKMFEAIGIASHINEINPLFPLLTAVSYLHRVEQDWRELMALVGLTPDATFQQFMEVMQDDEPVEMDDVVVTVDNAVESLYGLYDQD